MKRRLLRVIVFGLLFSLLVGCSTPAIPATPTLPGASGAPSVLISTVEPDVKVVEAYMTQENSLPAKKTSPAVFPSGTRELFMMVRLTGNLSALSDILKDDPNWVQVSGNSGIVELEQITEDTKMPFELGNGVAMVLPVKPTSGTFADGPYQATLKIKETTVAILNWTVGTSK